MYIVGVFKVRSRSIPTNTSTFHVMSCTGTKCPVNILLRRPVFPGPVTAVSMLWCVKASYLCFMRFAFVTFHTHQVHFVSSVSSVSSVHAVHAVRIKDPVYCRRKYGTVNTCVLVCVTDSVHAQLHSFHVVKGTRERPQWGRCLQWRRSIISLSQGPSCQATRG